MGRITAKTGQAVAVTVQPRVPERKQSRTDAAQTLQPNIYCTENKIGSAVKPGFEMFQKSGSIAADSIFCGLPNVVYML